jgi:hypothetical protein
MMILFLRDADVEKLLREAHISDFKLSAEQVLHVDKASSLSDAIRMSSTNTAISTLEDR